MKLRKLLRMKARPSSDEFITVEESLQAIAVELHRLNKSVGQGNELLGQFVQIAVANHKLVDAGQGSEILRIVEKLTAPLVAVMAHKVSQPSTTLTSESRLPSTVTKEGNGTRVEQQPEA